MRSLNNFTAEMAVTLVVDHCIGKLLKRWFVGTLGQIAQNQSNPPTHRPQTHPPTPPPPGGRVGPTLSKGLHPTWKDVTGEGHHAIS